MSQAGIISVGGSTPGVLDQLTGNSGTATADASHNINVITANTTVQFVGASHTLTEDFGLNNLLLGDSGSAIAGAVQNVGVGLLALHALTSGELNTVVGNSAADNLTSGGENTIIGADSGTTLTTGSGNTVIGEDAFTVSNGSDNIVIGSGAGTNAVSNYNILIGSQGNALDTGVIRIGTQGVGPGQQSQTFLAGVLNTSSGRVVEVTTPGAYPYTTLITDYVILVDTSLARTITPLAAPVKGTTYRIKDNVGSAAANNITITPSGKNIDGQASYVISTNWGSVDIVYNGSQWNVL